MAHSLIAYKSIKKGLSKLIVNREKINADLGLSVTGVAGPGGGTAEKPRGLVYIALAAADKTICREHHFAGSRAAVRQGTVNSSLNLLRQYLEGKT